MEKVPIVNNAGRICLNGTWDIAPGQQRPQKYAASVSVPALVDVADPPFNWEEDDYFWYRTSFVLPEFIEFDHIFLQLEQVQYGTEIWLNGKKAGGDIPCYTSQEFDLTSLIERTAENELLVRVGAKHTLPEHAAVGNDFEKISWIPGIWGDVWLNLCGPARVEWTRIIPNINSGSAVLHSEVRNLGTAKLNLSIQYDISQKSDGQLIAESPFMTVEAGAGEIAPVDVQLQIPDAQLWSPEQPFLYELTVRLMAGNRLSHVQELHFGMREFEIRDGHFYLNGHRRVLMGSNIPFHRLLSDSQRGTLPWNPEWARKALVDIPKAHNMSFFRFHLGRAYNRWYDLADEHGILLQDEWLFWTRTGSDDQIRREFRQWIREHGNHPSVIIWDALNESTDPFILDELIPELKQLDPTRPWEIADFPEDHPYIYSLGPVLNDGPFGFTRSIFELEKSTSPTMISEYIWWWLDSEGNPTPLTDLVKERWLGPDPTSDNLLKHQAFLAAELTELWRRLNIDAIMPFVYLSCDGGATANWFTGPLAELQLKPVMAALRNAFSPVGVSIELWDRHFLSGEVRDIPVYLFNDSETVARLNLQLGTKFGDTVSILDENYHLEAGEHLRLVVSVQFPQDAGEYCLRAVVIREDGLQIAWSEKPVSVFHSIFTRPEFSELSVGLIDSPQNDELLRFLHRCGAKVDTWLDNLPDVAVVIINGGAIESLPKGDIRRLTDFVTAGGTLLVQEPEYGVVANARFPVLEDLDIVVQKRRDPERGGYDSAVFPDNPEHSLWRNMSVEHLQLFNGGLGGEMVSQHNVRPTRPYRTAARCHLSLLVPAVMEIPYGKGWVIISRIQVRGRLLPDRQQDGLYGRRYDPVAEQYLTNLISGYLHVGDYHRKTVRLLNAVDRYMPQVRISYGEIHDPGDGSLQLHCGSDVPEPMWIWIELGPARPSKLEIVASGIFPAAYRVCVSQDNNTWREISRVSANQSTKISINLSGVSERYLRFEEIRRGGPGQYAIWKINTRD